MIITNYNYNEEAPEIIRGFLSYHETIKGQSKRTIQEYYLDLRTFFRYIKIIKNKVPRTTELDDISILDVDLELIRSVTLTDVYDYMSFLSHDRIKNQQAKNPEYGIGAPARARKVSSIRSFYKYLVNKAHLLDDSPVLDLEFPRLKKGLPKYLSLDEAIQLLQNVSGKNKQRDYCILMLFLNCGLRISELVGLNLSDVAEDHLRILGKGNKERIVFLNQNCVQSINAYLAVRDASKMSDKRPLFITMQNKRISTAMVHKLVKKHLLEAGIDPTQYSAHKLRHTAATLMLKNGVDVKTLQEVLGHDHLNTTEIYTHVDNPELRIAAEANPLANVKFDNK